MADAAIARDPRTATRRTGRERGSGAPAHRRTSVEPRRGRDGAGPQRDRVPGDRMRGRRRSEAAAPAPKRMPYVPGLDGLRAFAVFAVVLYHLKQVWAPCGLLGVTMFFVLSGYLITGLIIDEWRRTRALDLWTFWVKRIRRIMPAIGFLLLCLVILCGLFSPVMLTKLRNDFLPSLFFYNNWWQIFQDVSYFENLGSPSPVTHLWSLAIEEQFYIVWPVVLIVLFRLRAGRRGIGWFIVVLTAASAIEMALLYTPDADPSRVYYGTDTRAFSLLVGAWLAFMFPVGRVRSRSFDRSFGLWLELLAFAALGAVVAMVFTVSAYEPFLYRGGFLLVSVLTGVVIVALCRSGGILSRVFAWSPLVWLGKRSYGLYLWHYPLLLLMNPPTDFAEKPWYVYLLQIAVIIGVTEFSYHFIEEPIRHGAIGNALSLVRSRRETAGEVVRDHGGYASVGAVMLVAAIAFWIAVPPTQVMAGDDSAERTADPSQVMQLEQQAAEGDVEGEVAAKSRTAQENLAALPDDVWRWDILMIGDSVAAGAETEFDDYFIHGHLDARVSRPLDEGTTVLREWLDEGWNGDALVVFLGANTLVSAEEFERQYDELLSYVPEGMPIFVVNVRSPEVAGGPNNEIIAKIADEREDVYLIDWYNGSASHSDWFEADGTHTTIGYGTTEMLKFIVGEISSYHEAAQAAVNA